MLIHTFRSQLFTFFSMFPPPHPPSSPPLVCPSFPFSPPLASFVSPGPLSVVVLWAALVLPPAAGITCYSSHCDGGEAVCQVTCPGRFHFCSAFYAIQPDGHIQPTLFGCLDDKLNTEIPDTCLITAVSDHLQCLCNTSLCNNIGLPTNTTSSTATTPTPSPGLAPVHEDKPTGLDPSEYGHL